MGASVHGRRPWIASENGGQAKVTGVVMDTEEAARAFKALGDENRLRIMGIVAERGDVCACSLLDELEMTQPTLSHHMKLLKDAGLVKAKKEGRWMHYSLDSETTASLAALLRELG